MENNTKWSISSICLVIFISLSVFLLGFNKSDNRVPIEAYTVYLEGEKIGVISSKEEFEDYINSKEQQLKNKYEVDTIYSPKGVEIKKTTTYKDIIKTNDYIYNKIIETKKFTIKGVVVTITSSEGKETITQIINVINKEIFDEALNNTIKAFVNVEQYNEYLNGTQAEIETTGRIIENVDLQDEVTYKDDLISVDEYIFTDVDELAKYLLYGTLEEQTTYVVQAGDTIEEVASANKLNVQEFLIANPAFTSENNLLYESQEVVVGLIDPIINIVVEYHAVEEEEKAFETEIQYDDTQYKGYEKVLREGENGLYQVVRKYQYINGQLQDAVVVSSTELKPSVNKVVVKGDKYVPEVADLSYWAWPTARPYTITTYYEWRWGSFHDAIDIYVGYNSPIYAANNGTVYKIGKGCTPGYLACNGRQGNYVLINHNAGGYYTIYMHMNEIWVHEGDTVARGQQIGTMGNTGNVSPVPSSYSPYAGTHLHFGVRVGSPYGGTINPFNLY